MPDQELYNIHADDYERLITYEDYQGNLLPALHSIRPLAGLDVVEIGAGTGRLTRLVAPVARSIQAFDVSSAMLRVAQSVLKCSGLHNWHIATADHRHLPVGDRFADVVLAGWTMIQLLVWSEPAWRNEAEKVLAETRRVLRLGGTILILETLGTGAATPQTIGRFIPYHSFLEQAGFASTWIRTDFQFESPAQALALLGFFFGEALAGQWVNEYSMNVPECTGIWWLTV